MASRIASYQLAEASSGSTPTTTADDAGTLDLTITFNGGSWTSIAAGNGISVSAATGKAEVTISGGTALDAVFTSTGWTFEQIKNWNSGSENNVSIRIKGTGGYYEVIIGSFIRLYDNGDTFVAAAAHGGLATGDHCIQVALDFAQVSLLDRVKIWMNGTKLTTINVNIPAQNTAIDFTSADTFEIATDKSGSGICYNAGLYADILDDTEASNNATALLADNDTDPNGGGGAPARLATRMMLLGVGQ